MAKRTILCAIDFSESSLQALKWTMLIAKERQAQATFLFCYRLISASDEVELLNLKRDMETKALSQFQEIEKKFIKTTTVPYQFVMEVGFFSSRIELFLRKSPVNLLVLGNSMVKNFNEYKNLSFDEFLTDTKIPILIAPEQVDNFVDE